MVARSVAGGGGSVSPAVVLVMLGFALALGACGVEAPRVEAPRVDQCEVDAGRWCFFDGGRGVERCTFTGSRLAWGACGVE